MLNSLLMQTKLLGVLGLFLAFFLMSTAAFGQETTVTGTVVDDTGLGLPGVNIIVVGTSTGTVTDLDGQYSLTAPANATLRFSYIGFAPQEILVNGQSTVDVTLGSDAGLLDEVVVVGYGSQSRESVTGAISSVDGGQLAEVTTANLGEALQGRLAGVQVISAGPPGEAPLIQVRGIGSISFGSGPLIVVDGVPGAGGLNQFDSRDIETTTVLKDASSTAIYGSRASNGVILVTTKSGQKNSPIKLSFETTVGVQTQNKRYDVMNTEEYLRYAEIMTGMPLARDLDEIAPGTNMRYRDISIDYQDELFQDGLLTQNSLHVSGGGERSSFFSSFGYLKQEGIVVGGGYERFNFRINSMHDLTANGKFRFGQTLLLVNDDRNIEEGNLLRDAVQAIPYLPVRNPNNIGGYNGAVQSLDSADPRNPILAAEFIQNYNRVYKTLGTAFLEYDIIEGLTAKALFAADYSVFRSYNQQPIYESTVSRDLNQITESRSTDYSPLYRAQLTYDRILGDHSINATVVGEIQEDYNSFVRLQGNQTDNNTEVLLGAIDLAGQSNRSTQILQSFLGRATYGYLGRYLLTVSFRRDGSSIFAPGNNTEIFPAAAVAWRISEEPFMINTSVSTLKLRASYGRTGSIGLPPYSFQSPVVCSQGPVIGGESPVVGCYINDLANTELSWEITDMLNIGVDVGFFNNRLNFSAEFYDRQVDNLILDVTPSPLFWS